MFIDSWLKTKPEVRATAQRKQICINSCSALHGTYEKVKDVLEKLNYDDHGLHDWIICVELGLMNFLLGQQGGYIKYPCFFAAWIVEPRMNTG